LVAKEVIAFRNTHLKNEKKNLDAMKEGLLDYGIQRIKEWVMCIYVKYILLS
jgi:hypothetical protein